ncbi:MAG TPA: integrase arm-type DNA-binding domain-containing protein [Accumulibacter sp.]|nr:integrase arm-type DNA-binding domain-containing protein [Accumulibacter sp.]
MARAIKRLTPLAVSKASKRGLYPDGAGLYLQIGPTGAKSWIFRFMLNGKARAMGLGPTHAMNMTEARGHAAECRKQLFHGKDPIEVRKAAKLAKRLDDARAITFKQCADQYIETHRAGWKNAKHAAQWESTLQSYVHPVIGELSVAAIDTDLVVKCLSGIWTKKTETASRVRGRIESILDWATSSNYRQGENPARWRGHLDNLLAPPSRVAKVVHHPALPYADTAVFMAGLRKQGGMGARAVEFAILTAARSGEVRGATWTEINLELALWVIPAGRMKAEKEHRVPLSSGAIALLRELPCLGDVVFPGAREGKPLSDMSLTAVLRRMGRADITVHGFRSTFRDWCSESTNFPREVCEHALAHSLPDKVEAAYRRGDLIEKRTMLMQEWSDFCATTPSAKRVIPVQ